MQVREVMIPTSLRFYESELIKDISTYLLSVEIKAGFIFNKYENLVGVFTRLDIFTAYKKGKVHLKDILPTSFVGLKEEDQILELDFGASQCNPVFDVNGNVSGYLTKEDYLSAYAKKTHLNLKHYDAIFNSAHNGILSINSSGEITSINPAAVKMAKTTKKRHTVVFFPMWFYQQGY